MRIVIVAVYEHQQHDLFERFIIIVILIVVWSPGECQFQFRHRRWNCSTVDDTTVFGPVLSIRKLAMLIFSEWLYWGWVGSRFFKFFSHFSRPSLAQSCPFVCWPCWSLSVIVLMKSMLFLFSSFSHIVFNFFLNTASREAAFAHAVASAGVVHR